MRPDVMLLDEPSNHLDLESLIWLEHFLKGYDGALLMTSHDREFMNRVVNKIIEIDGGELTTLFRRLRVLRAAARARRKAEPGAIRAPAGDARQGDQVHRALQGARLARRAGAEPGEEARQDRARRAAAPPPDRRVRIRARAALGRGRRDARRRRQGLWLTHDLRRLRFPGAPPRALVRARRQRRRQVDAAEADRRRDGSRPGHGRGSARASRWAISPSTRSS